MACFLVHKHRTSFKMVNTCCMSSGVVIYLPTRVYIFAGYVQETNFSRLFLEEGGGAAEAAGRGHRLCVWGQRPR